MQVYKIYDITCKYKSFLRDNNKSNYVCDVEYITTYTTYYTARSHTMRIA